MHLAAHTFPPAIPAFRRLLFQIVPTVIITNRVDVVDAPVTEVSEASSVAMIVGAASPPAQNMSAPPLAAATPI